MIEVLPRDLARRLARVAGALAAIVVLGTAGYMWLEGWSLLDGLYMVITTIATVGFGEVHPLSPRGRILTILVILSGTGALAFLLGTIVEYIVGGELTGALRRRRVQHQIDGLKGHYIICGHGRVGNEVVHELEERKVPLVIVDRTEPPGEIIHGHAFLAGDASDDTLLERAGVARARGLVAAAGDDNVNIVIVLTARALNPDLVIVARASHPSAEPKLLRAGATHVISPYRIGGRRMATQLVNPRVTDFLDRVLHAGDLSVWIEETVVGPGGLAGRTFGEAAIPDKTGVNLLAVVRGGSGPMLTHPAPTDRLDAGDILIAFGTRDQLGKLAALAGGGVA